MSDNVRDGLLSFCSVVAVTFVLFLIYAWFDSADYEGHTFPDKDNCIYTMYQERHWLFQSEPEVDTKYCLAK